MPAVRRLKTADNVRAALAWVFRQVEGGDMELDKARVLIYAAVSLGGILKATELEARISALEARELDQ